MSYGSEPVTLDFTGHHVLCLSGDNGNGKSALLDAMTYALWGKTRASGSRSGTEDDLVRLGAEDMEIIFDFELENDLYRVVRRRNRRTRSGAWELQQLHNETAIPIGGSTMRETERRLASMLRMEYETFVNSAYIQQGRADEFTRQKPADRKRILSEILNLDRYAELEELAKEHKRECDERIKDLEGEMRVLEQRIAEEQRFREDLEEQKAELTRLDNERKAVESQLAEVKAKLAALTERQQRVRQHEANVQRLEGDKARIQQAMTSLDAEEASARKVLAQRSEVEKELEELNAARAEVQRLAERVDELHSAERAVTELRVRLEQQRTELEHRIKMIERDYRTAREAAQQMLKIRQELQEIQARLKAFNAVTERLADARKRKEELDGEYGKLKAQHKQAEQELAEIEEVLKILSRPRARCPVCEADLSGGQQELVIQRQQEKRARIQQRMAELKRQGIQTNQEREAVSREIAQWEKEAEQANTLRERLEQKAARMSDLQPQAEREAELRAQLSKLQTELEKEQFGLELRAEIAERESRIAVLEPDRKEYERLNARVRDLTNRQVEARYARIGEAERSLARVLREREEQNRRLAELQQSIDSELRMAEELRKQLGAYEDTVAAVQSAEAAASAVRARYDDASRRLGETEHALRECEAARVDLERRAKEYARVREERDLYTDLAKAFGKNGVPALIIENALPEIQDEANRLLGRMTDNGMKVVLTALRTGQSGRGQIETLDIRITDDLGERPYEMYSGGEAFRVNFAVRIALSRLLTKRAGAQLQTLILDEGFGSQDAKGRERLVEAIQSIQDEFRLIIVISHIEELKDAFPSRVEVIKTPAGSRIEYVE